MIPLVVIAWLDHLLGLITLFLCLIQGIYIVMASKIIDPFRSKSREIYKRNSGKISDIISNILAVRSSATEDYYVELVGKGAKIESQAFINRYIVQAKLIGLREALTVIFNIIILLLAVERMRTGVIDITTAILVITYATTILNGVYSLSDNIDEHDDLIDRIIPAFDILNRKNRIVETERPVSLGQTKGKIEFVNVNFKYDNNKEHAVLNGFNLEIPSGQKIGVVGLSGAGKSTITKLLLRFNDVDEGAVLIDDIDIKQITQNELRRNISYVPQEPLLFHTTIKENVRVGKHNATDSEVIEALNAAHAYEFVGVLPEKIDSIVGERGVKLSGGQKQRIAIARAVLQNAPIIVLDEATSALDSESEQIIKSSFREILKGRTAIVIAHRLSTLSEMDRIIYIDNGKIIEDGSHDELLKLNGFYAKLWRKQQNIFSE